MKKKASFFSFSFPVYASCCLHPVQRGFHQVVGQVHLPASKQMSEKESLADLLPSSIALYFSRGGKNNKKK